jgi:hypothetical protein
MDFVMARPTSAVSMVFAACARPSGVAEGSACAFALQMMMATAAPVRSGNVMRPPDISCRGEKNQRPLAVHPQIAAVSLNHARSRANLAAALCE